MYAGHCLCKQVRFGFETKPTNVSICHCSLCQHMTGSAFGAYVKVSEADLELTHGADQINAYEVTNKLSTRFCQVCGSTIYASHADHPGFVYISLGTMAKGSDIHPTYHEFVGSKASWYNIQDSLPKFDEWSDSN